MELNIAIIASVITAIGTSIFSILKNNTSTQDNEKKVNAFILEANNTFNKIKQENIDLEHRINSLIDASLKEIKDTNQSWLLFFDKTNTKIDNLQQTMNNNSQQLNLFDKRLIAIEAKISILEKEYKFGTY